MNIGMGDCTPVPTVTTNAQGEPLVIMSGCPSTTVDVLQDGTNVFHDNATGNVTMIGGGGIGAGTIALILGGIVAVVLLKQR